MSQDKIQDAIEDVKTWIGRSPASIDEMHYEREALKALDSLVEQIDSLTAERDESEGKVHSARIFIDALSKYIDCGATLENSGNWHSYLQTVANNWNLRMQEACDLRDRHVAERNKAQNEAETLKSELAALRSAPSMAEVDEQFGGLSARLGLLPPSRTREECQSGIEKCYRITCRFAAERDEVVRLLKWVWPLVYDGGETPEGWHDYLMEDMENAPEMLGIKEIVEGK